MSAEKFRQVSVRYFTFALLRAGILIPLALAGCATSSKTTTPVDVRSGSVAAKNLRMAYNFDQEKKPSFFHSGNAIEIGISNISGNADQAIASGQKPVILNQVVFNGPQQIWNEFDFTFYELSWRHREKLDNQFGMELSFGAGRTEVNMKSSSAAQIASQQFRSNGARVEYGLHYFLSQTSSFQARAKIYWAPIFLEPGIHGIGMLELVYAKSFHDNLNLRAGLSRWKVSGYDDSSFWDAQNIYHPSKSDIELDFFGPTISLNLEF